MENNQTSSAHTPGPWTLSESGQIKTRKAIETGYADYICQMPFSSLAEAVEISDEELPNARLIAAAPELLEACQALYQLVCDSDIGETPDDELDERQLYALELYQAATAKAYGQAS